jgi:hypothetical protein
MPTSVFCLKHAFSLPTRTDALRLDVGAVRFPGNWLSNPRNVLIGSVCIAAPVLILLLLRGVGIWESLGLSLLPILALAIRELCFDLLFKIGLWIDRNFILSKDKK